MASGRAMTLHGLPDHDDGQIDHSGTHGAHQYGEPGIEWLQAMYNRDTPLPIPALRDAMRYTRVEHADVQREQRHNEAPLNPYAAALAASQDPGLQSGLAIEGPATPAWQTGHSGPDRELARNRAKQIRADNMTTVTETRVAEDSLDDQLARFRQIWVDEIVANGMQSEEYAVLQSADAMEGIVSDAESARAEQDGEGDALDTALLSGVVNGGDATSGMAQRPAGMFGFPRNSREDSGPTGRPQSHIDSDEGGAWQLHAGKHDAADSAAVPNADVEDGAAGAAQTEAHGQGDYHSYLSSAPSIGDGFGAANAAPSRSMDSFAANRQGESGGGVIGMPNHGGDASRPSRTPFRSLAAIREDRERVRRQRASPEKDGDRSSYEDSAPSRSC